MFAHPILLALRSLRAAPVFTATALVTLALGIGVNTSMFSILNATLLRSLPYRDPGQLVRVYRTTTRSQTLPHSPANFLDHQAQNAVFAGLAAVSWTDFALAEPGHPAERVAGMTVTGDFFALLGVQPALGRALTRDDDQPGREHVVVLSDTFWRRRFSADPTIVGRDVRLDGERVTVVGVMPAAFEERQLWGRIEMWRPIAFDAGTRQNRGSNWLAIVGRLKPDTTVAAAQAGMGAVAARLARDFPGPNAESGVSVLPLAATGADPTIRLLSWFAMGLAGCVLLIACANLANLQLARNVGRARDFALHAALGASRMRVIRQSLVESVLLGVTGGGLGLLVAAWTTDALGSRVDIAGQVGLAMPLDRTVLAFTAGASVLTGVVFGILPAWLASRGDVNETLKQGGRGSTSRAHHRLRHGLIVAEVAIALVLLSAAGFFIRGIDRFAVRDHGWRTGQLLTGSLTLSSAYAKHDARRAFHERLQTRLAALPGVERVALSGSLPFNGFPSGQRFIIEGRQAPRSGTEPVRDVNFVSPEYFDTLGIGLVEGRAFQAADLTREPIPTIINETMARQFWPGQSALGKRIAHPLEMQWQEIVGVVRDVSFATNLSEPNTRFQAYRLLGREPNRSFAVTIRSALPPETLTDAFQRTVAAIDPDQPVQGVQSATRVITRGLANFALVGWLLAGFALLGLFLAAVGIYGVIAGFVGQRINEIGIRLALGAQARDVLRLVLGQGLRLALVGIAIGLFGTYAVARLLAAIAPSLPAPEATTAATVTGVLSGCALLACWLPARQAVRVDPNVALRAD
ncbi:MAG: ABC transporter permease [Vicinamibacteraceae bacterium]